jgi:hypothetical protein
MENLNILFYIKKYVFSTGLIRPEDGWQLVTKCFVLTFKWRNFAFQGPQFYGILFIVTTLGPIMKAIKHPNREDFWTGLYT